MVTLSIVDDDSLDIHTVNLLSTQNGYFELDSANCKYMPHAVSLKYHRIAIGMSCHDHWQV